MFYTGICDESAKTLDRQFAIHKELGWDHVELRVITPAGHNLSSATDQEFAEVCAKLAAHNLNVSCYAAKLGDWSRKITGDFALDVNDIKNALPRMKKLNIPFMRCMTYVNDNLSLDDWGKEARRRVKELAKIAADGGITLVHENCTGWAGLSWQNTLRLLEEVNSPALQLVFDTGNPPVDELDAWDFYTHVRPHIVYVHIKDSLRFRSAAKKNIFTFPGEGDGYVKSIVADLLKTGYTGGFSIEPHLTAVIHTAQAGESEKAMELTYMEYGQRLMKIMVEAQNMVKS
jgi:sugar phosphate isomerase/epimerase